MRELQCFQILLRQRLFAFFSFLRYGKSIVVASRIKRDRRIWVGRVTQSVVRRWGINFFLPVQYAGHGRLWAIFQRQKNAWKPAAVTGHNPFYLFKWYLKGIGRTSILFLHGNDFFRGRKTVVHAPFAFIKHAHFGFPSKKVHKSFSPRP